MQRIRTNNKMFANNSVFSDNIQLYCYCGVEMEGTSNLLFLVLKYSVQLIS